VTALNAPTTTIFAIPGIAHVASLNCQAGGANAELENDGKSTDLWLSGDSNYIGTNWLGAGTLYGMTGGATWHLGRGSGVGAMVITITASVQDTGSSCIFQGSAQVMTS
jgi:hypothetical protein